MGHVLYQVEYSKSALKYLKSIPSKDAKRILHKVDLLKEDPFAENNDVKKLTGIDRAYRLRVGNYRVVYELKQSIVLISIVDINVRGEVYK